METYERLKQETGDDEPILFIDGVHPTQGTKLAYGWISKGKSTEIETPGSRTRLNIMGALNLTDIGKTIIREYDTLNAENIARFFIAIREHFRTAAEFRAEIRRFFREILPDIAGTLSRRINDNFQVLKPASSS